jgi:hypothetical protein
MGPFALLLLEVVALLVFVALCAVVVKWIWRR